MTTTQWHSRLQHPTHMYMHGMGSLQGIWTQVKDHAQWSDRRSHKLACLPNGHIILSGGFNGSSDVADVWKSEDDGLTWTQQTASAPWGARRYHAMVALSDGSLVLMGGWHDGVGTYNDVWHSTDEGVSWHQHTTGSPWWASRWYFPGIVLNDGNTIIVTAGASTSYDSLQYNDTWKSTDKGASWTQMSASAGWVPRRGADCSVMTDGSLIIAAGYRISPYQYMNDVWRSTDDGATWTQMIEHAQFSDRYEPATMGLYDGSIIICGGTINAVPWYNDTWRSVDNGATWSLWATTAVWTGRSYAGICRLLDGSVLMAGGYNNGSHMNDVWRLT